MNDVSHKKFSLGFLLLLTGLGLLLFDLDGSHRIERYNPPGIAHYDVPYTTLQPTPRLFRTIFTKGTAAFPRRDTIVLIGNSVITGGGAKDNLFFNKLLAEKFNVLNAGLAGEFLAASLSLATIGVKAVAQYQADSFFHIFIAYPPTRLYTRNNSWPTGYWMTGPALYALARDESLENYIYRGPGLLPMEVSKQTLLDLDNYLVMNLRCMITRHVVQNIFKYSTPYCLEALATKEVSPGFFEIYNRQLPVNSGTKDLMQSQVGSFLDPAFRQAAVQTLSEEISNLARYMDENRLRYKIHFLLLGEAPAALQLLPSNELESYLATKIEFIKEIRTREPAWAVEIFDAMTSDDYFDESHFKESGYSKLAAKILQLTGK